MELRQRRYLVALDDERHFTRAAAREHIAQPALSQQIRRLEQEVGLPLVHRTTRQVALTEAGTMLVERARRVLGELEAARAELEELSGVRSGRVTIGAMQTVGAFDLSLLLATFHERHPGVELAIREEPSDTLAALLRADVLDLAILSVTDRIERRGLGLEQLTSEELVAVLPRGHRLAGRKRMRFAELADEEFIGFREGWALRHVFEQAAAEAGFTPRLAFESNELPRIRTLVARGLGVAVLPRSGIEGEAARDVAVVALTDPRPTRDVTLAWRADRRHAPAAAAFLTLARSLAAED
jgi:LysR family transcriptional activator of glutamate synthase operon